MTVLTVGLTSQLTATIATPTGNSTPSNVTWQSQAPGIAVVSSTGLVTAVATGTTTIAATAPGASGQTVITVQSPGAGTSTLSGCTSITTPGNYSVAGDIGRTGGGDCLHFANVAGVQLDCHNHTVGTDPNFASISMTNVNSVIISNCSLTAGVVLTTVAGATITHSTIEQFLNITGDSMIEVSDTTITGSGNSVVLVHNSSGVALVRDTISNSGNGTASAIEIANGSGNRVSQSRIHSTYDGGAGRTGTDDAILLLNETGDDIDGNSIDGFFDIGVEGVDIVSMTTISNNAFSNLGVGAIGSIFCTAWSNNLIQMNHSSAVPTLVFVGSETDSSHCGAGPPAFAFVGNQFIGNTYRTPIIGTFHGLGPSMSVSMQGNVTGNVLQGNDFASYDGPRLNPLGGFVDGGGNICGPLNPAISNFPCNSGTSGLMLTGRR